MSNTAIIAFAMVGVGVLLGVVLIIQASRYRKRAKAAKLPLDN
jgi:ABC-type spermidine/putrescine transport system permease subunit II